MQKLDDLDPVKKSERTHIQRQFIKWNKYWITCKDEKKKAEYFKQANKLGAMIEQELLGKQRD